MSVVGCILDVAKPDQSPLEDERGKESYSAAIAR